MSFINIAIGIGVGAAAGGITSAINKQPVWKGMLIGAGTGAAGGALGAGLGSLGGAAAGSTGGSAAGAGGSAAGSAVAPVTGSAVTPAASSAVTPVTSSTASSLSSPTVSAALSQSPTAITSQGIGTAANLPSIGAPTAMAPTVSSSVSSVAPTASSVAPSASTGFIDSVKQLGISGVGKEALKMAAPEVIKGGLGAFTSPTYDDSADKNREQSLLNAVQMANEVYQPLDAQDSSWLPRKAQGGEIRYAAKQGGSVRLRNGDFIVPADVVSAIGNGSTKAGAKYLDHLFNALTAGPAPKAGSLAKRRAQERRRA